ncbi:NAD(P)-dependent dehydrogenase (short-subunit alcohol dehydrogenase family) [Stackebrandtia albiflava]|uniref:NAD(P)-dependent dehydrogenase (Short-subunit alcohol dehydrogenase family) n=1 Tax=Stackebrandtia albiflava TaxID=406432 RepID=A0A562UYK9_9ACTN|nr:SDR family NAD(P)-dependent oxidoreductase [Stackebrandtia albiflava]TWJ10702.1 NAD(P)-dependent dehydrogenase (short-subunit alcohol dehydrogenase family) [Stackebrandtia albiflava]
MTKIALITGANRGIGFHIARGLGGHGVHVLLGCRSKADGDAAAAALRAEGVTADALHLDVTDPATVAAAAALVRDRHGRLDILVNNAGIALADGTWASTEMTVETLRTVYETNVFGVVSVTNACAPLLRAADAARIVNVSSEVGSLGVMFDPRSHLWPLQLGAYGSSKTALNALTVSYAKEFWDTPVKVNAVSPGYTDTDLGRPRPLDAASRDTEFTPDPDTWDGATPRKRTPAEGAAIAVELALTGPDGPTGGFFTDDPHYGDRRLPW